MPTCRGMLLLTGCFAYPRWRCLVYVIPCKFGVSTYPLWRASDEMFRFINADTLHSLQILGSESHPHSHNQGPTKAASGSKEGLSVYGLFHHLAKTPQGKYLLRQYFLRPSLNLEVIEERLDVISAFLRPENADTIGVLVRDLQSVRNMRTIMINLRKGISAGIGKTGGFSKSIWAGIRQVVYPWSDRMSLPNLLSVCIPCVADKRRIEGHGE
jgi:DNA mismatch repair protein MSH5